MYSARQLPTSLKDACDTLDNFFKSETFIFKVLIKIISVFQRRKKMQKQTSTHGSNKQKQFYMRHTVQQETIFFLNKIQ